MNTNYRSNTSLAELAQRFLDAQMPVLTTHAKPDGDAFGSVVALARALQMAGKRPRVLLMPPVPISFAQLKGCHVPEVYKAHDPLPEGDLYVIVDTGAWNQIAPMQHAMKGKVDRLAIVDHHLSGDIPAAWRYVDGQAAACSEIIAQLIDEMTRIIGRPLMDETVSEQLFVGIASDTGWFRFSNTRPQTHELAARLLRMGVDQNAVYEKLEQTDRPQKLALMTRALQGMRLLSQQRAAVMVLHHEDFIQTGARAEETERLIDLPRSVAGMEVVVLVSQPPEEDGRRSSVVRISFRSKPGPQAVDVAQLASRFGGGGHARASGAKMEQPLEQAVAAVSEAVVQAVEASAEATASSLG